MKIINLESGMPTVEAARSRLTQELRTAKMQGEKAVKIIHGYGSSGKGAPLRQMCKPNLQERNGQDRSLILSKERIFRPFQKMPAA